MEGGWEWEPESQCVLASVSQLPSHPESRVSQWDISLLGARTWVSMHSWQEALGLVLLGASKGAFLTGSDGSLRQGQPEVGLSGCKWEKMVKVPRSA